MDHEPRERMQEDTLGLGLSVLLRRLGAVVFRRAADSTLRFLEVDGPCAERMGLSKATLTGDAYSFWTRVDARDRRRVLSVLEEAIRKGGEYRVAYRLEAPDGRVCRVREEGLAVAGPDAEIVALDGIILEAGDPLTEADREQSEVELQELRDRFRKLAEHSREMLAELSLQGLVRFASARLCSELGRSESELQACDPLGLLHPEDREHVIATAAEALRSGESAEVLCRLQRADGSWLWAELRGSQYSSASGEHRVVVTGRNVDSRIRAEEAFLAQRFAETRIGELSRRFIELGREGLDQAIEEAIEAAAEIGGADRCYLMAFPRAGIRDVRTWLWQRDGLEPWRLSLDDAVARRNDWMRERLLRGEVVRIPRVSDLPDDLAATRADLEAGGIRSYCMIPVRLEGRVTALLGFQVQREERDWSEQELALLRLVAELLASALRRRDAEEALRDREQQFRALTDSARDGICENTLGEGEILYANPRFYEMHGYTPGEAAGMSSFDLMHPDDREPIRRAHAAFLRGKLGDSTSGSLLYRGLHKDGRHVWLEANGRLFRTASGEGRAAAVIRDVTEREFAQRAMERRLENQKRIANLARDLLALGLDEMDAGVTDGLAALLPISGADRSWFVATDPVTGKQESWEWRDEDVAPPAQPLETMRLGEYPNVRLHLLKGREVVLSADRGLEPGTPEMDFFEGRRCRSMLVIPLLSGPQVIAAIGFERLEEDEPWSDEAVGLLRLGGEVLVSAVSRRRAEQALRESRGQLLQAQKMEAVGTLAGGVAHDFNNQLSVILGNTRFLRDHVEQEAELREAVADVERAGEYCAQLTRQLLSFSRHVPAEPRPTSVSRVLRDVAELTGPLLSSDIRFEARAHDDLDTVYADRIQLQQVLVNLVVNARDAMPEGGHLTIRTRGRSVDAAEAEQLGLPRSGHYVQFEVADTGFGMDPDTLSRIFEPFFTTKEQGKGTGLGLATVYGILRESGGAIWADSQVGVGTTFRLLLPRGEEPSEDQALRPRVGLRGGETLLLVEDERGVRRLMRRMLSRLDFHVIEAESAEDALRIAEEHSGDIDVLVSDVSMPGMGGVELGRRLLASRPTLRVLLVTGQAEDDVSLPGAGVLSKPFRQEELQWALESLLGGS